MSEATILHVQKKKLISDRSIVEIRNHWNILNTYIENKISPIIINAYTYINKKMYGFAKIKFMNSCEINSQTREKETSNCNPFNILLYNSTNIILITYKLHNSSTTIMILILVLLLFNTTTIIPIDSEHLPLSSR